MKILATWRLIVVSNTIPELRPQKKLLLVVIILKEKREKKRKKRRMRKMKSIPMTHSMASMKDLPSST